MARSPRAAPTGAMYRDTLLWPRRYSRLFAGCVSSQGLVEDSAQLARLEGLEGHALAAEARRLPPPTGDESKGARTAVAVAALTMIASVLLR